jgi:hypothetical protein
VDRVVPYVEGDDSLLMVRLIGTRGEASNGEVVTDRFAEDPEFDAAMEAALANVSGVTTASQAALSETCTAALANVRRYHDRGNVPMHTISREACVEAFDQDVGASDLQALACLAAADSDEAWLACWQPGEGPFDDRRAAAGRVVDTLRGTTSHGPSRGGGLDD